MHPRQAWYPVSRNMRYIDFTFLWYCQMPPKKTATLNLRIDPAIKEAARIAALREHRSVANLVELLVRRHCQASGIEIPRQEELFTAKEPGDE